MTKKIAVINDLSGFGRCSLTAAISVIAAMGVQPCPLPTAILSGQTGYPSYFYDDYTDKMDEFCREWKKMGASFDGIYTGFMSDVRQIEKVFDFLDTFYGKKTFLLVDPIMGDDGRRFGMCTPDFLSMMKALTAQADIITPNLTELCFLSGTEFRMIEQMTDEKHLLTIVEQMARNVMDRGTKEVVVTGIRFTDSSDGVRKMGNLAVTKKDKYLSAFPFVGESYSGTGDLSASVLAGGRARGDRLDESIETAGRLIGLAMEDSVREGVPRNDGVNYEQYLWMLKK